MNACYQLADDLVSGQRKTLVVLGVVLVTVFGALCGLLLGFTLLQQVSLLAGDAAVDSQQPGSLAWTPYLLTYLLTYCCRYNYAATMNVSYL